MNQLAKLFEASETSKGSTSPFLYTLNADQQEFEQKIWKLLNYVSRFGRQNTDEVQDHIDNIKVLYKSIGSP